MNDMSAGKAHFRTTAPAVTTSLVDYFNKTHVTSHYRQGQAQMRGIRMVTIAPMYPVQTRKLASVNREVHPVPTAGAAACEPCRYPGCDRPARQPPWKRYVRSDVSGTRSQCKCNPTYPEQDGSHQDADA